MARDVKSAPPKAAPSQGAGSARGTIGAKICGRTRCNVPEAMNSAASAWRSRVSKAFRVAVKKSGLPRIHLHDLRHTHASILLKAGVPVKVVNERLGHSSPAFTMTVYQHVLPGMQADAAAAFGAAVFGS